MAEPRLNKKLYTDITRLKLLDTDSAAVRFRIDKTPFSGDEDADLVLNQERTDYIITGLIFPKSDIYNQRSYMIEMKLTRSFPADPPEVRFLTKIYHPNIAADGLFGNFFDYRIQDRFFFQENSVWHYCKRQ
jgi:ubiquitin-protein ligase